MDRRKKKIHLILTVDLQNQGLNIHYYDLLYIVYKNYGKDKISVSILT